MTIFSKIIAGDIPCYKIAEDENYFAFLDIAPSAKGHSLVVPKIEVDYVYDLDDVVLAGLHIFAKKVAKAIEKSVSCQRIGVAIIGLEVPHAHIHLIPMNTMADMDFRKKITISKEELSEIAEKIRGNF